MILHIYINKASVTLYKPFVKVDPNTKPIYVTVYQVSFNYILLFPFSDPESYYLLFISSM